MRHGKKFNHLGRQTAHRNAMLANLAISLIEHKRINTTLAKAKALRVYIEPLVSKSKNDTTHNRRIVFSYLNNKYAVTELFKNISVKVADRPGGYLRIIKLGNRLGDAASMAMVEFVDYNTVYGADKEKKTTTRRSRRKKSDDTTAKQEKPAVEPQTETSED
jgi:large subunit ribosomal protein L17